MKQAPDVDFIYLFMLLSHRAPPVGDPVFSLEEKDNINNIDLSTPFSLLIALQQV